MNSSILPHPRSSLPGGTTLTTGNSPSLHRVHSRSNLPNLTITPSVTITPTTAPPSGIKPRNVSNCNVIVAVGEGLKTDQEIYSISALIVNMK